MGGIFKPPAHDRLVWSVVTLVGAAVLGAVAALYAQDAQSAWSRLPVDGGVIVATRWPLLERCQAAATKTSLYVADPSGSLLWQWRFRDTNRFIHVTNQSTVALSPDCQHAVLAGNVAEAQRWHRKLFPLCRDRLGVATNPVPLKAAMALLGRGTGELRLPMTPLDEAGRDRVRKTLVQYGLL